ncbi:hypothetical protein SteCoe_25522 [Stentor coeruleus]|uniref:Uncharacterized protein n=1 Tax=Stentor coeruleus TaxID=5963 RepID=A0A1R2BF11_9CILI|nr:hypothetical protein SteCoe_25522 [Stentor coeruleus]
MQIMLKSQDSKANHEIIDKEIPFRSNFLESRRRKLLKTAEKQVLRRKSKRFSSTLADDIANAYKISLSPIHRIGFLSRMPTLQANSHKLPILSHDSIKDPTKLPEISTPKESKTKNILEIKSKENKLEELINDFIDKRQYSVRNSLPGPSNHIIEAEKTENFHYEKNLNEFRGNELKAYRDDIKKNLVIEKIRQKNHQRYKKKMHSVF